MASLKIERLHPYILIENEIKSQKELYSRLEPEKRGYAKEKEAVFATSIPNWLRTWDEVRMSIIEENNKKWLNLGYVHIPKKYARVINGYYTISN